LFAFESAFNNSSTCRSVALVWMAASATIPLVVLHGEGSGAGLRAPAGIASHRRS